MRPRSIGASTAWKRIAGGAVIALALGAVALTVLALQHVSSQPVTPDRTPVPAITEPATPAPEPSSTPTPTPPPTQPFDRAAERFLAVGSGAIWRGTAGECGASAPVLERSTDGGDSWNDVTPTYRGIGQLLAVRAFAGDQGEIVALMGDDCDLQALRTFTYGQFWEPYDDVLAISWFIDPTDPASVSYPGGNLAVPCTEAHGLRVAGDMQALICEQTAYVLTADETWDALPATGVAALAVVSGDVIVAHSTDTCSGVAITRYADAPPGQATELGCVDDADPATPMAVALSGTDAVVWTGDDWLVTTDAAQR